MEPQVPLHDFKDRFIYRCEWFQPLSNSRRFHNRIVFWLGIKKKGTAKLTEKKTGPDGSELKRQLDVEPVDKLLELT